MSNRSEQFTVPWTLEEFGPSKQWCVELEFLVTVHPGEPMVWRTANGDGYPGSPDELEFEVRVLRVEKGEEKEARAHELQELPFRLLDELVQHHFEGEWDKTEALLWDAVAEQSEE